MSMDIVQKNNTLPQEKRLLHISLKLQTVDAKEGTLLQFYSNLFGVVRATKDFHQVDPEFQVVYLAYRDEVLVENES